MHAFRFTKFILGILGLLIGNIRFNSNACFSCFCTWLRIRCVPNPLLANMLTTSCFSDRGASPCCPLICFVCMLLCDGENVVNHFCRFKSSSLEMLSLHEFLYPSSFLTFPWPRKLRVLTFAQICLMVIPC